MELWSIGKKRAGTRVVVGGPPNRRGADVSKFKDWVVPVPCASLCESRSGTVQLGAGRSPTGNSRGRTRIMIGAASGPSWVVQQEIKSFSMQVELGLTSLHWTATADGPSEPGFLARLEAHAGQFLTRSPSLP
jgi:hypothetical protein